MFDKVRKIFSIPELKNKILVSILILVLVRVLAHIPLPGVDLGTLKEFFNQNQFFGLLNMFSGGTMENFSIILMGVGPYITSSIIFQLLGMVVPAIEKLSKEGQEGQKKLNQYTRLLTVPLAAIQAWAMIQVLSGAGQATGVGNFTIDLSGFELIMAVITVSAGTILLMWLGELISENGIGNGISLIITLGILAGIPQMVQNTYLLVKGGDTGKLLGVAALIILSLAIVVFIVYINEANRKIPVSYAKQVRGRKMYGGVESFIPLKINQGGVIPIIFAMSMLLFPQSLAKFLINVDNETISSLAASIDSLYSNNLAYGIVYFILVVAFTYFYTAIVFNPEQVSENLQKQGGFIPGIRPGERTKKYLNQVLNRVTFSGSIFLGLVAVLPFILQAVTGITTFVVGGTGLLIVISVVLDTKRQLDGMITMRSYDEY
jgi:preprotein translocase subunit SecY